MFVFDWLDSYPWYVKWLTITFMVTFGLVFVRGLATLLAETSIAFLSWLITLPIRGVSAATRRVQQKSGRKKDQSKQYEATGKGDIN